MSTEGEGTTDVLQREVLALRARVAELHRAAARYEASEGISLSEREELLRDAERAAHLGTWAWDIGSGRVTWSEEMYRILGFEPGSVQPSVERFFASIHPEDRPGAEEVTQQGLRDGVLPLFDCRILRPDGSIRFTTTSGSYLFDAERQPRRMVGSVLDRTEAVAKESQLRRAFTLLEEAQSLAQMGTWRFDPATGEVEWSQELRRIIGVSSDVEPSIQNFLACIAPEDLPHFMARYQESLEHPGGGVIEGRVVWPSGEMRQVKVMGEFIDGPSGRKEYRGTLLDVTDQNNMRKELVRSQKMEAVGRLAGGIAHDFNNLLTIVLGNLEILESEIGRNLELSECFRALDSASNLTRRLLAFGRRAQLSLKVFEPNELVISTMHLMQRLVGDQVTLKTELADDLPSISVDALELERALVNLVINARDFSPPGGEVSIKTSQSYEDGRSWVHFSVSDQGTGIDDNEVSQVFEPFFTTRGQEGGTGLGLATVLGTAEQHGGTARVASSETGGTVFTISLPAASSEDSARSDRKPLQSAVDGARWKLLVIDDEPRVANVACRMLQAQGHVVQVATTRDQALEIWRAGGRSFDLVLCDVVMPELRGPELVLKMAERGPTPCVLFMSGYNEEATHSRLSHPVIAKPFSAQALVQAIARCLPGTTVS